MNGTQQSAHLRHGGSLIRMPVTELFALRAFQRYVIQRYLCRITASYVTQLIDTSNVRNYLVTVLFHCY